MACTLQNVFAFVYSRAAETRRIPGHDVRIDHAAHSYKYIPIS